jgi:hypothetical protein
MVRAQHEGFVTAVAGEGEEQLGALYNTEWLQDGESDVGLGGCEEREGGVEVLWPVERRLQVEEAATQ